MTQKSTHHERKRGRKVRARSPRILQNSRKRPRNGPATRPPFCWRSAVVIVWIVTGPLFNYSDTWQLVINTGTTIVTFLMVFLIQNTQNRDTMAVQLKLSELVLAMKGAQNKFAAIEDLSDEELAKLHDECRARAEMTLHHLNSRRKRRRPETARGRACGQIRAQDRKILRLSF